MQKHSSAADSFPGQTQCAVFRIPDKMNISSGTFKITKRRGSKIRPISDAPSFSDFLNQRADGAGLIMGKMRAFRKPL